MRRPVRSPTSSGASVGKRALALGGALLVVGGAALGFALTRKGGAQVSAEQSAAMAGAMGQLDGDIRAARVGAEQRAKTLAENDRIRRNVVTDAGTVADMIGKELLLEPMPNEVIELVQVPPAQRPSGLLVLPAGATGRVSTAPGPFEDLMGSKILVGHTVEIALLDEEKLAAGMKGYLTVTRLFDLAPAIQRLAASGVAGSIQVGGKSTPIGALPAGAATETKNLPTEPAAKLVVGKPQAKSATPLPIAAVGGAVAVLGLLVVLIGALSKSEPARSPPAIASVPTVESRPPVVAPDALTKLSTGGVVA